MPTVAANGTLFRGDDDVEFTPAGFTGVVTTDWTTVPWCDHDFGDYDNTATDHLSRINDPTAGIGDICRHMGVVDSTNWRMPTAAEWDLLYREQRADGEARRHGTWTLGSFEPLSGLIMGPEQGNVTITSNTQVNNADSYINGALFLPTSGFRIWDNGAIHGIGFGGWFWPSTASNVDRGYHMWFSQTDVGPTVSNLRAYAMPIRCIRE